MGAWVEERERERERGRERERHSYNAVICLSRAMTPCHAGQVHTHQSAKSISISILFDNYKYSLTHPSFLRNKYLLCTFIYLINN